MNQTQFSTPFHHGFLAIDPSSMIGTSNTPLSVVSHGDPIIADHSPPLNGVGRSQSADIFGTPGEHSQFGDEGLYLSESFNKQMSLPFRSPLSEEPFHSPMPDGPFNFNSPPTTGADMHSQQTPMNFQSPPQQTQEGSVSFHSPPSQSHPQQTHQDSGVSFSTPSNMSQDQANMYNSPKDSDMLYQDSKMYSSPGQIHQLPHDHNMYHQSPLGNGTPGDEPDINNIGMFGTIDPNTLGQHQQH